MGKSLTPGPPLEAEKEFCSCEPPSGGETLKAAAASTLLLLVGAALQVGVAIGTGRLWGAVAVLIGGLIGWLVHLAASRHRSVMVGAFAAGATVLASGIGYGLLWLPFLRKLVDQSLPWYYLLMGCLGGFIAYRMAGPKTSGESL